MCGADHPACYALSTCTGLTRASCRSSLSRSALLARSFLLPFSATRLGCAMRGAEIASAGRIEAHAAGELRGVPRRGGRPLSARAVRRETLTHHVAF
eukprot:2296024-Rhodomonas_salina.3